MSAADLVARPAASGRIYEGTSMPDRDWWAAMFDDPEGILLMLGVEPGMTVLDLCCGDGHFPAPLARMTSGRVYALDLDAGLIARAKSEVDRQGATVTDWIVGDARQADALLSERVDHVLLANTVHGVDDRCALVGTMASCLKEGGQVGLLNWQPWPREQTVVNGQPRGPATELRMSPADVLASLESGGFAVERVFDVPPYHHGVVAHLRAATVVP